MHTCPECGLACRCRGDIDDIEFDAPIQCECCPPDEYLEEDDDEPEFDACHRLVDRRDDDLRYNYVRRERIAKAAARATVAALSAIAVVRSRRCARPYIGHC